jgi:hypothetical protein
LLIDINWLTYTFDNSWPTDTLPAVNSDWSFLAKLFLCFVDLTDEVNEAIPGLWNTLFWPISELELTNSPGLSILVIPK